MLYKVKSLKPAQAYLAKQKMLRKKNKHIKRAKNKKEIVIPASPKHFKFRD